MLMFENLCGNCNHKNCCTDSAVPLVFSNDLQKIMKTEPVPEKYIQTKKINGKNIDTLKKKDNSIECVFWNAETSGCSIYESRPIDCRLYPFDIMYLNNSYHWIVYSCNENSDWKWSEKYLEFFESDEGFRELMKNIDIFTAHTKMILPEESKKTPFIILRKINWNDGDVL
ncbi:hypothetical protein C6990_02825 [Nitrosopumilus sp. b3]|nr:hypothetical protein C6990_02825 [Nitrosopumilus sp. b3]